VNKEKLEFEALIFDVGGVIVSHDDDMLHRLLAERCTAPDALEGIRSMLQDVRINTGEMPVTELHRGLQRQLEYSRNWNGFVDDWCCHFEVDRQMLDLVHHLALSNLVILFSNTNSEHWTKVRNLTGGAFDRFECYLSYQMGEAKPSLGSFRTVAARAHINPAHSLFIDDRVENVEAARFVGFQAEVFVSRATLEEYLALAQCK
jgi:FMN phosphatase YigB (HAD superfamily)